MPKTEEQESENKSASKTTHQTSTTSTKQSTPKSKKTSGSGGSSASGIDVDWQSADSHISYDDNVKACPQCITVSDKTGGREWTCPNDGCAVLNFTTGWNERADGNGFLQNIDWAELEEELQDILRFG